MAAHLSGAVLCCGAVDVLRFAMCGDGGRDADGRAATYRSGDLYVTWAHVADQNGFFDLIRLRQTKSRSRQLNLTLTNVREFLPQAPVYLLSDAGDPFDLEAKRFNVSALLSAPALGALSSHLGWT